jgi:hypothetical protein
MGVRGAQPPSRRGAAEELRRGDTEKYATEARSAGRSSQACLRFGLPVEFTRPRDTFDKSQNASVFSAFSAAKYLRG